VADKNRKTDSVVKDETVERGASKNGTLYRSATTGKYVTRSADRDPSRRTCETRGWFRAAGNRHQPGSIGAVHGQTRIPVQPHITQTVTTRRYLRPRPGHTTLGHANHSVTLARYSHCVPSLGEGTAAAMDEIFA
jgi:hypothetical protein